MAQTGCRNVVSVGVVRFGFIGLLILAAHPAASATVGPWSTPQPLDTSSTGMIGYLEVLEAILDSYRGTSEAQHTAYPIVLSQSLGLTLYAFLIAAVLPRRRRYPDWAAAAISRMRWTIARKPLDRWDDR